jgi:DNA polymerase (family 10)
MDKKDVASTLDEIAAYLELKGEDQFRVRAYQTAARAIAAFQGDLEEALTNGELAELKGIGRTTLDIVANVLTTGTCPLLERLRDEVPHGLVEMLRIPGLGVTKVRQIYDTLGVDSLGELEEAAREGRLANLPRFGPRTALRILKGIQFVRQVSEFRLLHHARQEARALARVLAEIPGVRRAEIAGSVRRWCEIIRDLDFVVELEAPPGKLVDRLGTVPGVREFVSRTDRTLTLRFAGGTVADIYWAQVGELGFQLLRATGAQAHLAVLKRRAATLGLEWTDTGLLRDGTVLAIPEETDVYRALDLPYIPPELREGTDEVDAAITGRLPTLIQREDLQGFLHCHSDYSDGGSTVPEWAAACRAAGYTYMGVTDHSQAAAYAGGLATEEIADQHAEIDAANSAHADFRVLKGVEADILGDGTLDYTTAVRATFDFIIASVHTRYGMNEGEMTDRILSAMDDPSMAILGHPTGRLLLSRDPYPIDLDAVFEKAASCGIALEINADPQRLDLDWRTVRRATDKGVTISIGADAHSIAGMENMDMGIGIARKGWLTRERVLNAWPLEDFLDYVDRRRSAR